MTPRPAGRDAQLMGPSMHAAQTSMACGQRRMAGRSSSTIERSWSAAHAVQTMTVNGRSVPQREGFTVPRVVLGRAAAPSGGRS